MHVHTVHVSLHDRATADQCVELMRSMWGRIDSMISLCAVKNEVVGNYSADVSLTTVWPDLDAYHDYEHHPEHLRVREQVLALMRDATTIDYTVASLDEIGAPTEPDQPS